MAMENSNGKTKLIFWLLGIIQAIMVPWMFYVTNLSVDAKVNAATFTAKSQSIEKKIDDLVFEFRDLRKTIENRRH